MKRTTPETIYSAEREDWDRNAAFYRRDERSALMRMLAAQRSTFYPIEPGQRVLDVGCGAGGTVAALREGGIDAVGIDFSPAMVAVAWREHGLQDHVTCADATCLSFDTDSFDVVIADGVLHHLAVQERLSDALREMNRVLRPGGRLCCFDRNGSLASAVLLRFSIGVKELIRWITRGERYASSATRNEIPFGGRRDLQTIRRCGFELLRRRGIATVPFFMSVVVLNAVQYFLSSGLRHRVERLVVPVVAMAERRFSWRWFSVEQLMCFEAKSVYGKDLDKPNRDRREAIFPTYDRPLPYGRGSERASHTPLRA